MSGRMCEHCALPYSSPSPPSNPGSTTSVFIPGSSHTHSHALLLSLSLRLAIYCLPPTSFSFAEFGGSAPRVTVEYDRNTGFMLGIILEYNRRLAKKNQALTGAEVRNRVCEEMVAAGIFEDKDYSFAELVKVATDEELAELQGGAEEGK
jgi:hypothetical protein